MIRRLISRGWVPALALLLAVAVSPLAAQQDFRFNDGQWQKQPTYPPDSPEGQLQAVRKLLAQAQGDHADAMGEDAQELCDRWIQDYPNHPLLVDAYFFRADAKVAQRDYYKALFDYEYVIRQYPGSERFVTALEREFEIARLFSNGMKRRLWGMRIIPAFSEGEEIFIRTQERAPGSEIGEKASFELGDHYVRQGALDNAATAYDMFLLNYPRSQRREQAMLKLIQANLAQFKGPQFDAHGLLEAAQRLKMYRKEFPAAAASLSESVDALLLRIDQSLALKGFYEARWYEQRGEKISAVYCYQRVVKDYPRTAAASDAILRLDALNAPVLPPSALIKEAGPGERVTPLPTTAPSAGGGR